MTVSPKFLKHPSRCFLPLASLNRKGFGGLFVSSFASFSSSFLSFSVSFELMDRNDESCECPRSAATCLHFLLAVVEIHPAAVPCDLNALKLFELLSVLLLLAATVCKGAEKKNETHTHTCPPFVHMLGHIKICRLFFSSSH